MATWNVEIDAADWITMSTEEQKQAHAEIEKHALLVWEMKTRMSVSIYGYGDEPPPLLKKLGERHEP